MYFKILTYIKVIIKCEIESIKLVIQLYKNIGYQP